MLKLCKTGEQVPAAAVVVVQLQQRRVIVLVLVVVEVVIFHADAEDLATVNLERGAVVRR